MSDDVTITVRVGDQTAAGFRDINGRLRSLDGRYATTAGSMNRSSSKISRALVDVKASLLSLAPAAVPVAASFAPIAAGAVGATTAVAAFGAAVIPQIASMKEASDAQTKYSDAVQKYGAHSKQAVQAQQQAAQVLARMPKATQQASAAYMNLKNQFKGFSDSTAKFTMAPVEKSFAVLGQIIPKLQPMVEGTSTQLSRLMNVAGGAVETSGFDSLSKRVSDFANSSLKKATDGAIHFLRVMSEGDASGPMSQFMDYAREQGPAVKELFSNLVAATANLAQGASQAGPGLLSIVNALAKMVSAVPPELIGNLMQVYTAFKLITLAGAGIAAVGSGVQSLAAKFAALQAASSAAGGGLAGLKAMFLTLGTAAKATVIVAGITLLAVALAKLSSIGKQAPPDVDRLTTSLANLGRTGKVTGEAARAFGTDLGGLADSLRVLSRPSNLDKTQQFLTSLVGMDSTPVKDAKEDLDGVDKALANLVRGGKADLAAVAFTDIAKAMEKQGLSGKELKGKLDDYKSALADAALEARLTAESQGLFGAQAQKTQAALDAQKASADGLRQSIQALNDANRSGLGGMIGFESAIDAAAKAAKDNAGALSMNHGVLDLNSEKARNAASALQDLASKTDEAAASARESGSSWETVNGIYSRGRDKLIEAAQQMGLTGAQASLLASQILQIPDAKTTKIDMRTEDAIAGLDSVIAAIQKTPSAKSVTVKALTSDARAMLESLGFTVKQLPNGRFSVTANTKAARDALAGVQAARDGLKNKTITLSARDAASATARAIAASIAAIRSKTVTLTTVRHTIGIEGTAGRSNKNLNGMATGGHVPRYAGGGDVQIAPTGLLKGPGSGTSDSILAVFASGAVGAVSDTEFVVNARETKKHLPLLEAINEGKLPKFASGGLTKGQMKGLSAPSDLASLALTIGDVRTRIKDKTSGRTETRLLHTLDAVGRKLMANEKSLTSVNKALEGAKSKLNDLKSSAAQLASSVKSNILSAANITRGNSGGQAVTVGGIMGGLAENLAKAQQFSNALANLRSKGLASSLLQQIGEAGIEGGGLETADALLGASSTQIDSLNTMQSQLTAAAGAAGKTTADSVYAAAIKAQTASVNRLQKSQDKLEKTMAALAKSLDKALTRAIGKKAAGGTVGAAASGGIRGGLTWVGEHEPELLQLPVGSRVWSGPDSRRKAGAPWESMLNAPRRAGGSMRASAAGAAQPIVVHQTIELDGRVVARSIFEPLKEEIRGKGGNVQATLGQPGR